MCADDSLFPLGQVVATPGALIALVRTHQEILELLARHQRGDWGVVNAADSGGNDAAVGEGSRILSVYRLPELSKLSCWFFSSNFQRKIDTRAC